MRKNKIILFILLIAFALRIWKIGQVPVSLFSDEVDIGYHAYSIIKTNKDYSGNFMPLHFESQADRRAPLYIYSAVPTVAIWGISPLGVRLPAAIFGVLGIYVFYKLLLVIFDEEHYALVGALLMVFSPWHFHYSRAAFEVTLLVFLLLLGVFLFLKAIQNKGGLWVSFIFFGLTAWAYSTAKLFTPILILVLLIIYRKEILKFINLNEAAKAMGVVMALGLPMLYIMLAGKAGYRFGYINIFKDPTVATEVDFLRRVDSQIRDPGVVGVAPGFWDKFYHNKVAFWITEFFTNFYRSLSSEFLFISGDTNQRHSIPGFGQFYMITALPIILGIVTFFTKFKDKRIKVFMLSWILLGVVPTSLTQSGGGHATRLIIILPPLLILATYGIMYVYKNDSILFKLSLLTLCIIYLFSILQYMHSYFVHFPVQSADQWHVGYKQVVEAAKAHEKEYDKIIISNADEPPEIFFAGFYPLSPQKWQEGIEQEEVEGFGELKKIDKYYFGQVSKGYESLGKYLKKDTLYIAAKREFDFDPRISPEKVPEDIHILDTIIDPLGIVRFYLISGNQP